MAEQSGHITLKVILGYLLLVAIAVCSVVYIYQIIEQVAGEEEPDSKARQKVYLVTNTLSLLYESEALGQLVGMPQNNVNHFNRTLNKAHSNMDSLRVLITDSVQLLKIDTIDMLLRQKRLNTRRLLETWKETNTEHLYTINIEKVIAEQRYVYRTEGNKRTCCSQAGYDSFSKETPQAFSVVWQMLSHPAVKTRASLSIRPAR